MTDRNWIEPIVDRVVAQVLEGHAAQLRSEIVRRVTEEIAAQPAAEAPPSVSSASNLAHAVADIQVGTSQKEILRALLDSSTRYASRIALFVVKGSHPTGWQARGFANGDAIKDFALDSGAPTVVQAISDRVPQTAAGEEFDARFFEQFGHPAGDARLFPLILKDKVAALVYADGGSADAGSNAASLDTGSLEVLVLSTSTWLEINALRKQVHKEPSAAPADGHDADIHGTSAHQAMPAPVPNDPFAGHMPVHAMAAAASAGIAEASAYPVETQVPEEAPVEMHSTSAAGFESAAESSPIAQAEAEASHPSESNTATLSPEEQEVHRKAQRFARLLVDEIKLYNQANVSEGRKNKDLYDRLKEVIEKSLATYRKRYGNTVAASGSYFQHELIRSLAEDDASAMGPNFRL